MKKLLLSFMCLLSVQYTACDMGQGINPLQVAQQSVTFESQETVQKLEIALTESQFLDNMMNLMRENSKVSIPLIAQQIKSALSLNERKELVLTFKKLFSWYKDTIKLSQDQAFVQTPAWQEMVQKQEMKIFMLLQEPLFATMVLRIIILWNQMQQDPTMVQSMQEKFGPIVNEIYGQLGDALVAE